VHALSMSIMGKLHWDDEAFRKIADDVFPKPRSMPTPERTGRQ
jgi:hypothetical protein